MYDRHLHDLLRTCSDEDLIPLRDYISANFTNALSGDGECKAHWNEPTRYLDKIICEIQLMGGNSIANILRGGKGVPYKKIVKDVAAYFGVSNPPSSVPDCEVRILERVLEQLYEGMDSSQKEQLMRIFRESGGKFENLGSGKGAGVIIAQFLARAGGFATYKMAVIVANYVSRALLGRGLSFAANAGLTKAFGVVLGPIGLSITALWTAIDIAGPAYRTTVPCVLHIAYLRLKKKHESEFGG